MPKVSVIGAGIAGITTAFFLTNKGYDVDIYDRGEVAGECSFANGGQMSVSNSMTWNSWSNIIHGMQWMFKKDAPLAMRLDHWSLDKIKWIARFVAAIPHQEANTRKTIETALRSRDLMHRIVKYTGIKYDENRCGIMHIYRNQKELDKAGNDCDKYRDTGWDRDVIDLEVMKHLEPQLNYNGIIGGTFTPGDYTGDINMFCKELLGFMRSNKATKVRIFENTSITEEVLKEQQEAYDYVFLCTGVGTGAFVQSKIYPIKGYSMTFNTKSAPRVSILDDEKKIVASRMGNRFRVAGTAELCGWDKNPANPDRLYPLLNWAKDTANVDAPVSSSYACLRPMNPDMMPTVEKYGNLIVNSGAGHLGWTMGAALAERAVDYV